MIRTKWLVGTFSGMATFEMAIQVEKGLGPFRAAGKLKQRQGVGRTTEELNASRLLSCELCGYDWGHVDLAGCS